MILLKINKLKKCDDMYKKNSLSSFISIILLKVIFDYLYYQYVSKFFRVDLLYLDYSFEKHVYSYIILAIISVFVISILNHPNKPSRVIILLLFLSIIMPLLTLYAFQNAPSNYVLTLMSCFLIIIIQLKFLPNFRVKVLHSSLIKVLFGVVTIIYIYVYSYLILTGGIARFNFNLEEVYDVRAEYIITATKGPFLGYFITWIGNSFNMGILCWGLIKKNKKLMLLAIVLQLFLFGMTNFKSFLFAPLLVIFLYFFTTKKKLLLYSTLSVSALLLLSYFYFIIFNDHQWSSMFIRRQFFIPSNLHLIYYDFFKQDYNPFIYLSNSIFQLFLEYPYEVSVPRIISWEYWNKDFGPNVGFLGDAYSHFGFMGMFIFSAMLGIILKVLDSFVIVLPSNLISALIAIPAFSLVNSALFTTMLTHGFLISLLTLLIMSNLILKKEKK